MQECKLTRMSKYQQNRLGYTEEKIPIIFSLTLMERGSGSGRKREREREREGGLREGRRRVEKGPYCISSLFSSRGNATMDPA